jgi:hypothetical protein
MLRRTFLTGLLLTAPLMVLADLYQPPVGSAERAAIMDAARAPISGALGQDLVFMVEVLNSNGAFAYLQAIPQNRDGSAIDFGTTLMADFWNEGTMGNQAMVLLQQQGGTWTVLDWVMGPTDVYWMGWVEPYGLPEGFFLDH